MGCIQGRGGKSQVVGEALEVFYTWQCPFCEFMNTGNDSLNACSKCKEDRFRTNTSSTSEFNNSTFPARSFESVTVAPTVAGPGGILEQAR